jgi:hypothetical protein
MKRPRAAIFVRYCAFQALRVTVPKGPRGEKRPADIIGNAVRVMRIATGEETDDTPAKSAASELGSKSACGEPVEKTAVGDCS